ncbi:alpha-hydroxy acid oxidase [Phyllobacterium zundukense]|uniref:Alpha-hydroxy-acid oxidizing enzyme n=1 Tax=Phyllobacterium zundukense TaxID=1867719 RepID=A0A2N9VQS1_9HYPH|nr:alpha-hydroxy acid oxidase [Phyllobacterium zundukense]ATU92275.1 alpha-hydroxy-acid oxidizing enzyme [Phyllobacterium zundukense]PIO41839.1 alpha-hydroxy-acid oxidizing enzyme [Phyllobacterium zundukense]
MTDTISTVPLPIIVARERAASWRQSRQLKKVLCLDDFEPLARRHLPRPLFGYIAGASETNSSLSDNRRAFSEYGFRPHILTDVSTRNQSANLFGTEYASPFGIAPMGISALMAYRGDIVLASAARAANIPMIMSGSSLIPLEDVSAVAPNSWFQAYLPGEPERIDALLDRVEAAGFRTLVLTVDVATLPSRENNVRAGFSTPLRPSARLLWEGLSHPSWSLGTFVRTLVRHGVPHFENSYATRGAPILSRSLTRDFGKRDHLNWRHLDQIRRRWNGRLIVKGIMRVDDAKQATAAGVDGIIISNHGGRQLDYTVSPLRVLSGVAEAVGHSTTVMMDGGIRRGTDVLKAWALGAKFVFVGRPFLYAAGVGGKVGVAKAIDLLSREIHQDMALLGANTLDDITPDLLTRI